MEKCEVGDGTDVEVTEVVGVGSSQHPQKIPGLSQIDFDGDEIGTPGGSVGAGVMSVAVGEVDDIDVIGVVEVGSSQHPQKSPGVSQYELDGVELEVLDICVEVVVAVVALGAVGDEVVAVAVIVVAVVSSRQPHQPGVLQVDVLLVVVDVVLVVEVVMEVVVLSEPLLWKNFHNKQSTHSSSAAQGGTLSYASRTSAITGMMLCLVRLTPQPLSATVS